MGEAAQSGEWRGPRVREALATGSRSGATSATSAVDADRVGKGLPRDLRGGGDVAVCGAEPRRARRPVRTCCGFADAARCAFNAAEEFSAQFAVGAVQLGAEAPVGCVRDCSELGREDRLDDLLCGHQMEVYSVTWRDWCLSSAALALSDL